MHAQAFAISFTDDNFLWFITNNGERDKKGMKIKLYYEKDIAIESQHTGK